MPSYGSGSFIGVDVQGAVEAAHGFRIMGEAVETFVVDKTADFMLARVKTYYPRYRHVTRYEAYPDAGYKPGWFSKKQFIWFMENLRKGKIKIPYNRTNKLKRGWRRIGESPKVIIINETKDAYYTHDNDNQAHHETLVGWKRLDTIMKENEQMVNKTVEKLTYQVLARLGFK